MKRLIVWYRARQKRKRLNAIRRWLSEAGIDVSALSDDELEAAQAEAQARFIRAITEVFVSAAAAQRALANLGESVKRFADSLALAAVGKE